MMIEANRRLEADLTKMAGEAPIAIDTRTMANAWYAWFATELGALRAFYAYRHSDARCQKDRVGWRLTVRPKFGGASLSRREAV